MAIFISMIIVAIICLMANNINMLEIFLILYRTLVEQSVPLLYRLSGHSSIVVQMKILITPKP